MTHVAPLVAVILASSLLGRAAADASVVCAWTKHLSGGGAHHTFLRPDASSPRLYHSVWSATRNLRACAWSDDAAVIRTYLSLCRERAGGFSEHADESFDLDSVFGAEERCAPLGSAEGGARKRPARSVGVGVGQGQDERSEVRSHLRVKRGFIVPGTLWCGSGNKALSYQDLGVFSDTDSCCREHDQCKHTIQSFHSDFGVFNTNIFTMSHCDCDNKFRSCLRAVNDRLSSVVGYTFFNLLKIHCFEFSHRLQCMQRNWFGMCKETKMALYALVHPPTLYELTNQTGDYMNSTGPIVNATTPESSSPGLHASSIMAAASTLPAPSASSPSAPGPSVGIITASTAANAPGGPTVSAPEKRDHLENTLPVENQTRTEPDTDTAETWLTCDVFRDLDACRHKIPPQQRRYGIQNLEPRTVYHCNCTVRLFQNGVKQRQLTEVQALLLGHVSQSCFLNQDCTPGKTCTAALVKVGLPQLDQRSSAEVEEQRHPQAVRLKVRKPDVWGPKRAGPAVRLHKLCLRMTRPKQNIMAKRNGQDAQQPVGGRELV